jgi:hypothetical protein
VAAYCNPSHDPRQAIAGTVCIPYYAQYFFSPRETFSVMQGRIWFLLVDSDCVRLLRKPCFLCDWLIQQLGCHAMRCARRKNATNPHPNFEAAQLGEGKECGGTQ